MAVYTLLDLSKLTTIADDYGLSIISYKPMESGACNTNYHLHTSEGEFILTMVEEGSKDGATRLANILQYLERHAYPTTRLRLSLEGNVVELYDDKPVLMKAYIKGDICQAMDATMLLECGKALAHLHQIPAPDFLPRVHYYQQPVFTEITKLGSDPDFENWLSQKLTSLEKQLPDGLPSGLIHGDLFWDNILFLDKKLEAVIDLEEACHQAFVFDLGMTILGVCMKKEQLDLDMAKALVAGYQSVRQLEESELNCLQLYTEYSAVKTASWRFWKYVYQSPDPKKFPLYRQMARMANNINSIPKSVFLNIISE